MKVLLPEQRSAIVQMIQSKLVTMSIANDLLSLLGYGRAIHLSDIKG